jgi:hypothetical protein
MAVQHPDLLAADREAGAAALGARRAVVQLVAALPLGVGEGERGAAFDHGLEERLHLLGAADPRQQSAREHHRRMIGSGTGAAELLRISASRRNAPKPPCSSGTPRRASQYRPCAPQAGSAALRLAQLAEALRTESFCTKRVIESTRICCLP